MAVRVLRHIGLVAQDTWFSPSEVIGSNPICAIGRGSGLEIRTPALLGFV